LEIVRVKNRFDGQNNGGYKDVLINIRFLENSRKSSHKRDSQRGRKLETQKEYKYDGHICEVQLHHEKYQIIRSDMKGHDNYTASRFMIDFVREKARYSSVNESDERKLELIKLIQKLQ